MEIIKAIEINKYYLEDGKPLLICNYSIRLERKLSEAGYECIDVNPLLAKALLQYPQEQRPKYVEPEFKQLLINDKPILIKGIEMLFNPYYKLNLPKLFEDISRSQQIAVLWPGEFKDNKLIYALPEDQDYQEYDCNLYQMRCVI